MLVVGKTLIVGVERRVMPLKKPGRYLRSVGHSAEVQAWGCKRVQVLHVRLSRI